MDAPSVVLAGADRESPFRFAIERTLVGANERQTLPGLVDSRTRRVMKVNPDAKVLFLKDGETDDWERSILVDASNRAVVEQVVHRLAEWQQGQDEDMFRLFSALLLHRDERVHQWALRELDRAEYSTLQALMPVVPTALLLRDLNLPTESGLKPIRLLLLGLNGGAEHAALFEAGVARNLASIGPLAGVNSVAWMEVAGVAAVEALVDRYLVSEAALPVAQELIVEALAIQAQSPTGELRAAIEGALTEVVQSYPEIAPMVARQFGARLDWSMGEALAKVKVPGVSVEDMEAVERYVTFGAKRAVFD